MRIPDYIILSSLIAVMAPVARADENATQTEFHGAGWVSGGLIERSFATQNAITDYNDNFLGNSGGLVAAKAKIDENWEASMGLGTIIVHLPRGLKAQASAWYPFWVSFVDEARLTYSTSEFSEKGGFQLNLGSFSYKYNQDTKNLGLYLLNGYVYPGTLTSGFKSVLSGLGKNVFGAMGRLEYGGLRSDFILNSELEEKPLYDFSLANVTKYTFHPSFEIGAGINFYRLIPQNKNATSPGKDCTEGQLSVYAKQGQENPCFIIRKDAAGVPIDTVTGSLAGTKLMGRFRLDPKAWFSSSDLFGAQDLVFYGEMAVIGLKDYPVYYNDILRRIPVMVGFNLPGFGFLNWSVEVEYYASKNSSDNLGPQNGSWLPRLQDEVSAARDDWKWSLNATKMLTNNIALAAMAANDHLRLGGTHNNATGVEAMRTGRDWYWASQLAFFF